MIVFIEGGDVSAGLLLPIVMAGSNEVKGGKEYASSFNRKRGDRPSHLIDDIPPRCCRIPC